MSGEFNCDFDAPMFVDFENLDQEGNPDNFFGKCDKRPNWFGIWLKMSFYPDTAVEDEPVTKASLKDLPEPPPELPPRVTRSSAAGALKRKI